MKKAVFLPFLIVLFVFVSCHKEKKGWLDDTIAAFDSILDDRPYLVETDSTTKISGWSHGWVYKFKLDRSGNNTNQHTSRLPPFKEFELGSEITYDIEFSSLELRREFVREAIFLQTQMEIFKNEFDEAQAQIIVEEIKRMLDWTGCNYYSDSCRKSNNFCFIRKHVFKPFSNSDRQRMANQLNKMIAAGLFTLNEWSQQALKKGIIKEFSFMYNMMMLPDYGDGCRHIQNLVLLSGDAKKGFTGKKISPLFGDF